MLIFGIISMLVIKSNVINAHHYGPEFGGHCTPGMYIEISGEYLFYDPLLGSDCNLWWSTAMSNFYELIEMDIVVEHQRLIDGIWQDGPKDYHISYDSYYLGTSLYSNALPHYLAGGGYLIEGFNLTDYDRYRLVVILEGASTHYPTFTTPSDYDIRVDQYSTDWIYGLNSTEINPSLDNAPDGFANEGREEEIPTRPSDRDQDGVPDATDQCPDIAGPVALQGCPVSIDEMSNGRIPNLPSSGPVCTVETSLAMTFIFDVEPGASIPVGTSPIARVSDNLADANHVTSWEAARLEFGGTFHEYMVYPAWSSLVRIGGTCGVFDGSVSAISS